MLSGRKQKNISGQIGQRAIAAPFFLSFFLRICDPAYPSPQPCGYISENALGRQLTIHGSLGELPFFASCAVVPHLG
jgi:hypothetical protein